MAETQPLADLVHATKVTNELSTLLPRLAGIFEAHQKAVDQLQTEQATLAADRAALAERERAVSAREASCKAIELQNEQSLDALKQRELELIASKTEQTAQGASAPPQKKLPAMDNVSMQVLARATATALLKHGLQKQQATEVS